MTGPIRNLRVSVNILKELYFVAKHLYQKSNELIIMKCYNPACVYCAKKSTKAEPCLGFPEGQNFHLVQSITSQEYP